MANLEEIKIDELSQKLGTVFGAAIEENFVTETHSEVALNRLLALGFDGEESLEFCAAVASLIDTTSRAALLCDIEGDRLATSFKRSGLHWKRTSIDMLRGCAPEFLASFVADYERQKSANAPVEIRRSAYGLMSGRVIILAVLVNEIAGDDILSGLSLETTERVADAILLWSLGPQDNVDVIKEVV